MIGEIVGPIVGSVVLAIVVIVAVLLVRRRKNKAEESSIEMGNSWRNITDIVILEVFSNCLRLCSRKSEVEILEASSRGNGRYSKLESFLTTIREPQTLL